MNLEERIEKMENGDIIVEPSIGGDYSGYYEVKFYDDDGNDVSHWITHSGFQEIFRNREDVFEYIEKIRNKNIVSFTQTIIKKI